jgi:heme-degrading monooxygenase HmoA
MYILLWEFVVEAEAEAEFRVRYGAGGDWARLFAHSPGYMGTELLQSAEEPARYLTIDRWTSETAFQEFLRNQLAPYRELDASCERLTRSERRLGAYRAAVDPSHLPGA